MPEAEFQREGVMHQASGLWATAYTALWLNLALLAWLVVWPRHGVGGLWIGAAWTLGLGVAAWFVYGARQLVHDALLSLEPSDRTWLGLLLLCPLLAPVFFNGCYVLVDGLQWTAAVLLLMAARPVMLRLCLGASLWSGFWAAFYLQTRVVDAVLLTAFGASWLLALGAAHFAWLGEPHGVPAGWARRRVVANAGLAGLAGAVAGALAWWWWPVGGLHPAGADDLLHRLGLARPPRQEGLHLSEIDWAQLFWLGVVTLLLTALVIGLILYLRRWLLKRFGGGTAMEELLAGQVQQLQYTQLPPEPPGRQLGGVRGQMVALWCHWAATLAQDGLGRRPDETARQFAARLEAEIPAAAPPAALTQLFEQAHYGDREPGGTELAELARLVETEVDRALARRREKLQKIG
jgi:hypothetical protein